MYLELPAGLDESASGLLFGEQSLNRTNYPWRSIIYRAMTDTTRPDSLDYTAGQHLFQNINEDQLFLIDKSGNAEVTGLLRGKKSLYLDELAAAEADFAGRGQVWVRNDSPNIPMFTDDTGDDYRLARVKSGTFTPVLWDDSNSDAEGQTYAGQSGKYWVVDDLCYVYIAILMSSLGTLTNTQQAKIGGLPFAAANPGTSMMLSCAYAVNLNLPVACVVTGRIPGGQSYCLLERQGSASTGAQATLIQHISLDGILIMQGFYAIA